MQCGENKEESYFSVRVSHKIAVIEFLNLKGELKRKIKFFNLILKINKIT